MLATIVTRHPKVANIVIYGAYLLSDIAVIVGVAGGIWSPRVEPSKVGQNGCFRLLTEKFSCTLDES